MTTDDKEQRQQAARDLVSALRREAAAPPPPDEEEIWAYALETLDPEEESRVRARIAEHPEALETLAGIRKAIASSHEMLAPSTFQRALAGARAFVGALGREASSFSTVVAQVGEGLVTVLRDGLVPIPAPAQSVLTRGVSAENEGDLPREAAPVPRVEWEACEGVVFSLKRTLRRTIDLGVSFRDGSMTGTVVVARLTGPEGGPSEDERPLQEPLVKGRALFRGCPEGSLEVALPDGRSVSFCVLPCDR